MSLKGVKDYNSTEVKTVIQNLEFLTHKTSEEAHAVLNSDGKFK